MTDLKLAIATTDYDHFRDFRLGLVRAEGTDHNWLTMGHHEIFAGFTFDRQWEVRELSFEVTSPNGYEAAISHCFKHPGAEGRYLVAPSKPVGV